MDKQKVILVIDDDLSTGRTLKNLLTANNYIAIVAKSGAEGIQKAFELIPDLILCAINMRPIGGFQVIKTLKKDSTTQQVPFVFLTMCTDIGNIRLAMQMGAGDYIVKPFNNGDLIESIKIIIEKNDLIVEQRLKEFYTLMHIVPYSIIVFEEDGILNFHDSTLELLGFDRADLLGKPFTELVAKEERDQAAAALRRIFLGNAGHGKMDLILKRKDDKEMEVEVVYFQTFHFKAKPHFFGIIKPKLNKQLAEAGRKYAEMERNQEDGTEIVADFSFLLSRREREVLELSCQGLLIKEIAEKLFISNRTVEKHRASIMAKTGARNIVEAIIFLIKKQQIAI